MRVGTKTEVVRSAPLPIGRTDMISDADPARIARKLLHLAVVSEVIEVQDQRIARLHRVHQAEAVEFGFLVLVAFGYWDDERLALELVLIFVVARHRELHLT